MVSVADLPVFVYGREGQDAVDVAEPADEPALLDAALQEAAAAEGVGEGAVDADADEDAGSEADEAGEMRQRCAAGFWGAGRERGDKGGGKFYPNNSSWLFRMESIPAIATSMSTFVF